MKFVLGDEQYFHSRKKKADRILAELAKEGVGTRRKVKVLEVGCNHGFISYHLASMTSWEVFAGDLNREHVRRYPWIKEKVNLSVLDATNMGFKDSSFDVVLYNHVIEHIPEWEKTIQEIYRVLKPQGLLYLATPNLHRKYVNHKVLLADKKTLGREKRMELHAGFSAAEIRALLRPFSHVKCINKEHFVNNAPAVARPLLGVLSEAVHEKYAQTNVFIARK